MPPSPSEECSVLEAVLEVPVAKYRACHALVAEKCASMGARVTAAATEHTTEHGHQVTLTLAGPQQALRQVKLAICEELMGIEEQLLDDVTPELSGFLASRAGEAEMEERLAGLRAQVMHVGGRVCVVGTAKDCVRAAHIVSSLLHTDTLSFPTAKYRVLEPQIHKRCEAAYIRVLAATQQQAHVQLTIQATKSTLLDFAVFFKGKMLELEEQVLELSDEKRAFLQSPNGEAKLASILHGLNAKVICVDHNLVCVGSANACSKAVALIESAFSQDTVTCPLAKYNALEKKIAERLSSMHVRVVSVRKQERAQKTQMTLEATQEVIEEAKLFIYQALMNVQEQKLSPQVECLLRDKRVNINTDLKRLPREKKEAAAHIIEIEGTYSLVGSAQQCQRTLAALQSQLCCRTIPIHANCEGFMASAAWLSTLHNLRTDGRVLIEHTTAQQGTTALTLSGSENAVKEVALFIEKLLDSTTMTCGVVAIDEGIFQFVQRYRLQELQRLQAK
jgi:hypothetical protein